jgi:hypothetical protein
MLGRVRGLRYLWLLIPGLGVVELGAHLAFAARAPSLDAWRALAPTVRRAKRAGEPVVVAPEWAEPLARLAFGDAVFPLAELARADDDGLTRVLEVSALGARHAGTSGFRVVSETQHASFTLRVLENPRPIRARYRLLEHVSPSELSVTVVEGEKSAPCVFSDRARVFAGGLHGAAAFPRERFVCPGSAFAFVGITVIDDQDYRPRRCLWAEPPPGAVLKLVFADVPFSASLRGFGGLSYFLFRDSDAPPITLALSSQGTPLGRYEHHDRSGWHPFRLATPSLAGKTAPLELEVSSRGGEGRDFCLTLEVVE